MDDREVSCDLSGTPRAKYQNEYLPLLFNPPRTPQPAERAFLSFKEWHVKGPYKLLQFNLAHTRKSGLSQASYLTRHIDLSHFGN